MPEVTVNGVRFEGAWLMTCRLCGPLGVAENSDEAHDAAREHLAFHGMKEKL